MFACGEPRRAQGRSVGTRSLRPRPRVCARRAWRPVTRPFGSAILGNPAGAERASKQAPKALLGLPQAPRPLAGVKASTPPAKVEASVLPGSTQDGASAATGGRPGLPLRRGSESHTGPPSPKPPAATRLAHRRVPRLLTCPYLASCSKAPLSSPFTACEAEAGKLLRPRLLHSSTLGLWYGELSLTPGEEEKASGWSSKPCASA